MLQPKQSQKEKKNTKDATQMKNMKPVFKGPNSKLPMPKNLSGKARNGKPVKKAFLGSLLGGAGKSMLGGIAGQALGGIASQALGGLMGGGNKGGGQAAGGQGGGAAAQTPMPRKSTDMTPVKTKRMMKKGGKVTKAKNGKSFPDLNKDGKITKADILKGRGVIAKKGAVIKKAQDGTKVVKGSRPGMGVFRTTKERTTSGGVTEPYKYKTESIDTTGYSKGRNNYKVKTVEGEGDKTRSKVTSTKSKVISRKDVPSTLKSLNKAKTGGSMKKCKYGCK